MGATDRSSVIFLSTTLLAGLYCLHGLGFTPNGVLPRLTDIVSSPSPKWPGTSAPLEQHFTGFPPIDNFLANLNPFFAHVYDASNPSLTLWTVFMYGQYVVSFGLCVLESQRAGNKGKVISFITVFFTLAQAAGWAVIFPLWSILYTLTSPLAFPSKVPSPTSSKATSIPINNLKTLPYALTLAYIIPVALPALTSNPSHRQKLIALWQVFPLLTALYQQALLVLYPSPASPSTSSSKNAPYKTQLSKTYRFLLAIAVLTHLPVLVLTLLSAKATLSSVYVPHAPLLSFRAKDLADGVHVFLWWDVYVSSVAGFIWAGTLLRGQGGRVGDVLPKVLLWTLIAGPWGGVANLIWERDEISLRGDGGKVK